MTLSNVLDQYMKNLDALPETVKKNMLEIRQLDAHCQKLNFDAQIKVRQLISSWKNISKDARKKSFEALKGDFAKMKDLCDNKIRLSAQTYELVDKYIIRLDNDTAKFNSSVRKKLVDISTADQEPESRKRKNTMTRKDNKKARDKKLDRIDGGDHQDVQSFGSPAPLVDMPVDPNEPTYCICHQVSFGQMVMCDNKNCGKIVWLKVKPSEISSYYTCRQVSCLGPPQKETVGM